MSQQLFHGVGVQALKRTPRPKKKKNIFQATKPLPKEKRVGYSREIKKFWHKDFDMWQLNLTATYYRIVGGEVSPPIRSFSYLHIKKGDIAGLKEAVNNGKGIAAQKYGGDYGWKLNEILDESWSHWLPTG